MPELPEVETIRLGLQRHLPGLIVKSVSSDTPKSFPNDQELVRQFLIGATITKTDRRAKVLLIELNTDYSLIVHLKMTGQLVFIGRERWGGGHPNDSLVGELPDRSTRVTMHFTDESTLYFNDQRKFGWMRLVPTAEISEIDFFRKVGPEPLGTEFSLATFRKALVRRKNTSIKAAILDQTIVAGVGNIYADESLHIAGIHPATRTGDVPLKKIKLLHAAIPDVMRLSLAHGGSSDKNYVDVDGNKGSYLKFARVFRREGQPCPDCGAIIEKIRVAGRGTHFCPACQKLPRAKKVNHT